MGNSGAYIEETLSYFFYSGGPGGISGYIKNICRRNWDIFLSLMVMGNLETY